MSVVVLDASAGFELLTTSSKGQAIRRLLESSSMVLAPDLYFAELANVCWKAIGRDELSLDDACRGLRFSTGLIDSVVAASSLMIEALAQASATAHPVYDLLYLTLARREAAALVSMDKPLRSLAKRLGVSIADF